ncbi:MAG TPA: MarR family transcriptional regulator [Polyangiales bacterium]
MVRGSERSSGSGEPVSGLEDHLGFWLRFVSNHVSSRFRRHMEENGVSVSEWVALRQLHGSPGLSPRALIDSLGMTKGAISKLIDRLEHKQLARRRADAEDGRVQRVELTAAGRRLVPRLAALADENDAHFFGHLAPSTRDQLVRLLRQLVQQHGLTQVPTE